MAQAVPPPRLLQKSDCLELQVTAVCVCSYDTGLKDQQLWRIATSQLSHVDLLHLIFNLSVLWTVGFVEAVPEAGTGYYVNITCWLLLFTGLVRAPSCRVDRAVIAAETPPNHP